MKSKKSKKFKLNLFQKVKFDPESNETVLLVLLCIGIFGISFFASGKLLYDYRQKEKQSALNSQPERQIIESVLAAENQKNENIMGARENILPEGKKVSGAMSGAADLVKGQASRVVKARRITRQRAAAIARINSAPVLAGRTNKLPNGLRVCPVKSDHPQSGGRVHTDEDCCADYNEYPNPRCYYTPAQMGILKRR